MRRFATLLFIFVFSVLTACTAQGEASNVVAVVSSSVFSSVQSSVSSSRKAVRQPKAPVVPSSVALAAIVPAVPPVDKKIPILVYHHIRETKAYPKSTWSWKMSVAPAFFDKHMKWLKDKGYTTITLDTYAAIMRGEQPGPAKPVVITFDDNQYSQVQLALPTLRKYGHIGVFYLVTNRLDLKGSISKDEVRAMAAEGMDIQSHTVTHASLTNLTMARLDVELKDSRKVLEELSGRPVLHIAYPSVMHNKTVREHAKAAGYVTGSIMDPRWATVKDDWLKLPRIMMTDDTSLAKVLP